MMHLPTELKKIEKELIERLKASRNIEKNKSGNYQIKGTRILISELMYFFSTALLTLVKRVGEEVGEEIEIIRKGYKGAQYPDLADHVLDEVRSHLDEMLQTLDK